MTTPQVADGTIAAVLLKLGEISVQLAVMSEQLKTVPDHESRIRALEKFRFSLMGAAISVSLAASTAGTVIGYLVHH